MDVEPVTEPLSVAVPTPEQRNWSLPAFTTGAASIMSSTVSVAATQSPLPVELATMVTVPELMSLAPGVYVVVVALAEPNVPSPSVDQLRPVETVTCPFRVTTLLFEQTVWSAPAFTEGASVMVSTIESLAARQPPLLVEVSISVTVPAAVSAALGA